MKRQRHSNQPCGERCALLYAMTYADPAWTLLEIGKELGVTRERARQLIAQHGWRKPLLRFTHGGHLCHVCGQRYPAPNGDADHRAHRATHPPVDRRDYERMAVIVAAYEAGWLLQEIIEEIGINHTEDVYHYLEQAGYKPNRGFGWPRRMVDGRLTRVIESVETQQIREVQA